MGNPDIQRTSRLGLLVAIAAVAAEAIHLEGIIGAFLAGLAVNTATRDSEAKHELEFIGNHLFIPVFFLEVDPKNWTRVRARNRTDL